VCCSASAATVQPCLQRPPAPRQRSFSPGRERHRVRRSRTRASVEFLSRRFQISRWAPAGRATAPAWVQFCGLETQHGRSLAIWASPWTLDISAGEPPAATDPRIAATAPVGTLEFCGRAAERPRSNGQLWRRDAFCLRSTSGRGARAPRRVLARRLWVDRRAGRPRSKEGCAGETPCACGRSAGGAPALQGESDHVRPTHLTSRSTSGRGARGARAPRRVGRCVNEPP
jgi:hypothetical protein